MTFHLENLYKYTSNDHIPLRLISELIRRQYGSHHQIIYSGEKTNEKNRERKIQRKKKIPKIKKKFQIRR